MKPEVGEIIGLAALISFMSMITIIPYIVWWCL